MSRTIDSATLPTFLESGKTSGRPVVFLHGIGATAKSWNAQLEAFPNRRVLAWNASGYAGSPPLPQAQPMVDDYARALLGLLDREGVGPAALVASSWGAPIALAFAALQPTRVERLVLTGPTAGYGELPPPQVQALLAERGDRARRMGIEEMLEQEAPRLCASSLAPGMRERLAQARIGVSLDGFLQALHALVHANAVQTIRDIACPTLIVYGEQDEIAPPPGHALRLAAARRGVQVRALPRCGHLPHVEHPDAFNRLLGEFIGY